MEVTEKNTDGLDRSFQVKVPASELDEKLVTRLTELKGQVHLKGFRKGKAPVSFLKKMYGKGVMSEIVQEIVEKQQKKHLLIAILNPLRRRTPIFILIWRMSSPGSRILSMMFMRKFCRSLSQRKSRA